MKKETILKGGGIFKNINGVLKDVSKSLIIFESWKKQRERLQMQCPGAKVTYSYRTKQFRIEYPLPKDFFKIKRVIIK